MFGISYIFHPFEIIDIFILLIFKIMEFGASRILSEALKKKRKSNDPQTMHLPIGMVTFIYYLYSFRNG